MSREAEADAGRVPAWRRAARPLARPSEHRRWRGLRLAGGILSWIVLASVLASASAARPATKVLVGKVGLHNTYKISLAFSDGRKVKRIPAGAYTFEIHDYSAIHNFALGSQTENKRLFTGGIRWIGTTRYTRILTPGTYVYACSAHPYTMNGTFIVTAS
jgi:plastocyanin